MGYSCVPWLGLVIVVPCTDDGSAARSCPGVDVPEFLFGIQKAGGDREFYTACEQPGVM